jgi:hypothetical protein
MDEYITFQLKKNKANGKVILFILAKGAIPDDEKLGDEVLDTYFKYVEDNPGLSLLFDCRQVTRIPKSTIMKKMGRIKDFDPIARKNIVCSAPVVKPGPMITFIKMVTSMFPMTVPNKICYDPNEAKKYISEMN